jgi:tape measure domain-containing protein
MSENSHSIAIGIDASASTRGANDYKRAISNIITATKHYQSSVERLNKTSEKADFSKVARELHALSSSRLNSGSATELARLSSAMRNFRSPSASQVRNASNFLRLVSAHRFDPSLSSNLAAVSASFSTFKAPSKAKVAAISNLVNTLSQSQLNEGTAAHIAAVNHAFTGFRGPNAASVRNIGALVDHLNRLHQPANLASLATTLNSIATAGTRSNARLSHLTGTHSRHTTAMRQSSAAASHLRGDLLNLSGGFSITAQAGAALSSLFSALAFANFTRGIYDATTSLQQFQNAIAVTTPNLADAAKQMEFATGVADRYGISLNGVYDEYGKFATAAKLAGQSTENVQYIFESVSSAMRVMGTDVQGQKRVFTALTQMFSKGTIAAEELKQQLGEQLPATFSLMQDAISERLGKKVDLNKMLQLGQVDSSAILLLAKKLSETFGGQVATAMDRADASVARLSNSWTKFQQTVGQNGVQSAIGDVAKQLAEIFDSSDFRTTAIDIAKALAKAIHTVGDAAAWALAHVREISAAMAGFAAAGTISGVVRLTSAMQALGSSGAALSLFTGAPAIIGAAVTALALYKDELITIGDQSATVSQLANQAFHDIGAFAGDAWAAISSWNFDSLNKELDGFALAAGSAFGLISLSADQQARLTADSWNNAFRLASASAEAFGTKLLKSTLQLGSAAKNYGAYQLGKLTGGDQDELWKEFITKTKGEFDYLEGAADDTYKQIAKNWNLSRKDIAGGLASDFIKRARELGDMRDALAREAAKHGQVATNQNTPLSSAPNLGAVNPLKDSTTTSSSKTSVAKRLKDAADASRDYKAEVGALLKELQAGKITLDQYNSGLEYQTRKLREVSDPFAALVANMQDENSLLKMSADAQERERSFRAARNELLEQGVSLTDKQAEALRRLIDEQQRLHKGDPFKDYVDGIQKFGRATDEIAVKAVDGLADQIASAVATGKADFASLAQSILQMFIKSGLQSLFKELWGGKIGGNNVAAETLASMPAATAAKAAAAYANDNFKDVALRGTFSAGGDPGIAASNADKLALQHSELKLRGGLDALSNSTGKTLSTPIQAGGKVGWLNQMYAAGRNSGLTDLQSRVMASQAALESGYGSSGLSRRANNYFGMKAGSSWSGDTVTMPTKEQRADGSWYSVNARFRRYDTMEASMADHAAMVRRNWPQAMTADTWDGAMAGLRNGRYGAYATDQKYAGKLASINAKIDPSVTGSIQQVNTSLQTLGTTAQQASVAQQSAGQAMQAASVSAQGAGPSFEQAGQAIANAGQTAQTSLSDLGSLLSAIPGVSPYAGIASRIFGLFREGGVSTQPVAFTKAPHFAEGTPNTGSYGRGGIPSVLHPNEAVIPLSRGRKVPVEMNMRTNKASSSEFGANSGVVNNFSLQLHGVKDADGFKKSKRQIQATMADANERALRRNC